MNTFYHAGHLGDIIFSLYTIKKAGGGDLYLGVEPQRCTGDELDSIVSLAASQPYINAVFRVSGGLYYDDMARGRLARREGSSEYGTDFVGVQLVDFDIAYERKIWSLEWCGVGWPANFSLKKKYFFGHFHRTHSITQMLRMFDHNDPWIVAPATKDVDVVFHMRERKLRHTVDEWQQVFEALADDGWRVVVIGGKDIDEFPTSGKWQKVQPVDMLDAADWINSARLFMGVTSGPCVIADALDKFRLVDVPIDAFCSEPKNPRGANITQWPVERIIDTARMILNG